MAKDLKIAAIALIVYAIVFIPLAALTWAKMAADGGFGENATFSMPSWLVVMFHILVVVSLVATILWIRGFVLIGRHLENRLLVVSSYLYITASVIFVVLEWIPLDSPFDLIAFVIAILFAGIVLIPFGIGILRLQKEFGGIATAFGIMLIAEGACIVQFFPAFLEAFLEVPTAVLGVIILFKAARHFQLTAEQARPSTMKQEPEATVT